MKKIAFLDSLFNWPPRGGCWVDVKETAECLQQKGFNVKLFVPSFSGYYIHENTFLFPFCKINSKLPFSFEHINFEGLDYNLINVPKKIKERIDIFSPDYIFISEGYFLKPYIINILKEYNIILRVYAYEMVCLRNDLFDKKNGRICNNNFFETPSKCISCFMEGVRDTTVSAQAYQEFIFSLALHPSYLQFLKKALAQVNKIIVYNEFTKNIFKKYNSNIEICPSGINTDIFYPRIEKTVQKKIILMPSRCLYHTKGFLLLRGACDELYEQGYKFELVVTPEVQDGKVEKRLFNRPYIRYLNWVSRENIVDLYADSDICVFPSLWREPFGIALIEAMSMAKPVIASNIGGHSEIIKDGHDGLLFPLGNQDELAKKLKLLLEDDILCRRIGIQAREKVKDRYRLEDIINKHYLPILEKSDILLLMCPEYSVESPPLGLASLSQYLNDKGLEAEVLDCNIDLYEKVDENSKKLWSVTGLMGQELFSTWNDKNKCKAILEKFWKFIEEYIKKIVNSPVKIIGFSVYATNVWPSYAIAKEIKKRAPEKIIIFGGPQYTNAVGNEDVSEYADILVVGEGEETLYEIVKSLKENKKIDDIAGAVIFNNGQAGKYKLRPCIKDLDTIPFPTYKKFNLNSYMNNFCLWFMLSRGCIRRCVFCNDTNFWPGYRVNSPEIVVREFEYHIKNNGIKHFNSADTAINGSLERLSIFCDLIIKKKIKINISGSAIIRTGMDYDFFMKMKEAGFTTLIFGLESGSDKILKRMNKYFTIKCAEKILKDCHNAGIESGINIIVGFPGETENDFMDTLNFIKRNRAFIDLTALVNICHIFPNSFLYDHTREYGIKTGPTEQSDAAHWESVEGGNNLSIRKERMRKLIFFLFSLKYFDENIFRQIINREEGLFDIIGEKNKQKYKNAQ